MNKPDTKLGFYNQRGIYNVIHIYRVDAQDIIEMIKTSGGTVNSLEYLTHSEFVQNLGTRQQTSINICG